MALGTLSPRVSMSSQVVHSPARARRAALGRRLVVRLPLRRIREAANLDEFEPHVLQLPEQAVQALLVGHRAAQDGLDGLDLGGQPERVGEMVTDSPAD